MYRILLLVAAVIVYGSLYPWDFHYRDLGANPLLLLWNAWPSHLERSLLRDVILNVLLYIPLGAAALLALVRRNRVAVSICGSVLIGFTLSTSMELAQLFDRGRVTSLLDVVTNTIGTLAGALLALTFLSQWGAVLSRRRPAWKTARGALMLLAIWVGYELYPLVPSFGIFRIPGKLVALARGTLSGLDLAACTAEGLAVGILLEVIFGQERARLPFAWILLAVPARLLLLGRSLALSDVLGAAAAFGLWMLLPREPRARYRTGVAIVLGTLLLRGLAPFHLAVEPNPFHWKPFTVSMGNDWLASALVLLRKLFDYGSAVWLAHLAGLRYLWATGLVAAGLAAIEAIQVWLPGRASESTDPVLALMLGFILWRLERDRVTQRHLDPVAPRLQ